MNLFKSRESRSITSICVLGPDGSGKTTLINNLSKKLALNGNRVKYEHLRPKIIGCDNSHLQNQIHTTNPHSLPPRNNIFSAIKLFGFVIMYYLEHLSNLRASYQYITVWDRYIYDIYADPRRYRIKLPQKIVMQFINLSPDLDIVFILDIKPDILRKRKIEVSARENERQYYAYRKLAKLIPNSYVINANQHPSDILDDIWNIIKNKYYLPKNNQYNL